MQVDDDAMARCCRGGTGVDPDEPMAPRLLVGVDDPETGCAAVRLLAAEDGRRILHAADPAWPGIVVTADNETEIRGTVVVFGRAV